MKNKLPTQLPEEWLKQIQNASKMDRSTVWLSLLGTGFGSAILAALIGAGASLVVEHYRAQTASTLELEKARIETKKARVAERQELFEKLADSIRRLNTELSNTTATLAVDTTQRSEIKDYAQESLARVDSVMAEIFEQNRDDRIDEEIRTKIREMANSLDPALKAAEEDARNYPALIDLYNKQLNKSLREINKMIEEAMEKLMI